MTTFEVVRDPLWNNIRLEPEALAVVDTPTVQRLRYVRQLGHAFLVYPGATHTRFAHALGTYHLARRVLAHLDEALGRPAADPAAIRRLTLAALLHDIGHYPFSHALEEAGLPHHEALAERHLAGEHLGPILARLGIPPTELLPLIQGVAADPLAAVLSGPFDVDKLDYLSRDAQHCGVPYGLIDVDRLLAAFTIVEAAGRPALALTEKGLAPLESLVFAKYQMYRNVYWHHAVRSATCMFKRLVRRALAAGGLTVEAVALATDDGLIHELGQHDGTGLARALRDRRLAKRALDLGMDELPDRTAEWPSADPDLLERVEDAIAIEVGLPPGAVLLDFPAKPAMLEVDVPLLRRDGGVGRYAGIPRAAGELYRSARRLRLFATQPLPTAVPARVAGTLVEMTAEEVTRRLSAGAPLIATRGE